ncbi:MAG: hypothetical protein F7B61_06370 [Caldisphaeraceae archaeon]|nr:hypothetical protein [Caldisphaeraceae archaeon]
MREVLLKIDMGRYKVVELALGEAKKLLEEVSERLGIETKDLRESFRILNNFDEYLSYQKRKFKDYITPDKDVSEMIRGVVAVDNIKLDKVGEKKWVTIVFDRRLETELVVDSLKSLGFSVKIERAA